MIFTVSEKLNDGILISTWKCYEN